MPVATESDALTEAEARLRAGQISDISYNIELDLSDDRVSDSGEAVAETFTSITSMSFRSTSGETFLNLSAESAGLSVRLNGQDLTPEQYKFENARLYLNGLRTDGRNDVKVVAQCRYQQTGYGLHRLVDPTDHQVYLYTHFEPFEARRVFACFDQPDLKAKISTTVTAPEAWKVCSNGRVTRQDPDRSRGTLTWTFNQTPPLPTYLMAVVAGAFHVEEDNYKGKRLSIYCRQSLADRALNFPLQTREMFEITKAGLDFFAEEFGLEYPFDEYNQAFVPEFNSGAMENPGCVTFNEIFIFRSKTTELQHERRAEVILHEMAHVHGFGDVVTMKWWGDLWLNETFATYMAHRSMVKVTRFKDGWVEFANSSKNAAIYADQLRSTHPISTPCPDTDAVKQNFDNITYQKGGAVLKQLVAWVGDEGFVKGIRSYFVKYRWANASLSDFLQSLQEGAAAANRSLDLSAWSRLWLETTGVNTLTPEVTLSGGKIEKLTILQSPARQQDGSEVLRPHHVRVGLYRAESEGSLVRYRQFDLDITGATTEIAEAVGETAPDLIIANDDDLTFARLRFDAKSVETLKTKIGWLKDRMARSLCWAALWDMTRDADLDATSFVSTILDHADGAADPSIVERLLRQAVNATEIFVHPEGRSALRSQIAEIAGERMRSAPAGSDVQLNWARCWICTADSDGDLDLQKRLLEGNDQIGGLNIDRDIRWLLIAHLCEMGRDNNGALVAKELNEHDSTDEGRRRAVGCLSARPTAEAKAEAWKMITEGEEHLAEVQATMVGFGVGLFPGGGFWQPGQAAQDESLRQYADRYFQLLPETWRTREFEMASRFSDLLFPRYYINEATIAAADKAIAAIRSSALADSIKRAAERSLTESEDQMNRAIKAQALSRKQSGPH